MHLLDTESLCKKKLIALISIKMLPIAMQGDGGRDGNGGKGGGG
jgi:hypothetical protein